LGLLRSFPYLSNVLFNSGPIMLPRILLLFSDWLSYKGWFYLLGVFVSGAPWVCSLLLTHRGFIGSALLQWFRLHYGEESIDRFTWLWWTMGLLNHKGFIGYALLIWFRIHYGEELSDKILFYLHLNFVIPLFPLKFWRSEFCEFK